MKDPRAQQVEDEAVEAWLEDRDIEMSERYADDGW
jgi:hypothetical protein